MPDINLNESELRYGISALDIKYKEYADNDELLVNGKNGTMLYKRPDGQIVTPSTPYGRDELITAINKIFTTNQEVEVSGTDYLVYNTIVVNEKMNIISSEKQEIAGDITITSDKLASGIFVRIRGNSETNAVASYLSSLSTSNSLEVSYLFEITELGTGNVRNLTIGSKFDTLAYAELYVSEISEGCTGYQVKLKSVSFPLFNEVYSSLDETTKSKLSELNQGNTKFEPSEIDLIYYTSDSKNSAIYSETDNLKLNYVIPASEINHDEFIISESQPSHKCMWAKVIG